MEWLVPHIARINNLCNTLESGQKTFIHITSDGGSDSVTGDGSTSSVRDSSSREMSDEEGGLIEVADVPSSNGRLGARSNVDEDIREYPPNNNIDFKEQVKRYHKIMQAKAKTLPVSVIVSDRTNSTSSSAPSPSSSVTGGSDISSRHGGDEAGAHNGNNLRMGVGRGGKSYNYKPAPMVRKSERRFISAEQKDKQYWERRKRNNAAAKKSRESRREKEIEVNRKSELLQKENEGMRFTIMNLQERNTQLENSLNIYKEILVKNNLIWLRSLVNPE